MLTDRGLDNRRVNIVYNKSSDKVYLRWTVTDIKPHEVIVGYYSAIREESTTALNIEREAFSIYYIDMPDIWDLWVEAEFMLLPSWVIHRG